MAKWIKQWALFGVVSLQLLVWVTSIASACMATEKFDVRNIDLAEIVFRGRVEAYEELEDEFAMAKLSFVVDETFKGPQEILVWDVLWQNSTFGVPKDLSEFTASYGREFIVGLAKPYTPVWVSAGSYSTRVPSPELLEQPWILQAPCSSPFMFGVSEGNVIWMLFENAKEERTRIEEALRERELLE